LPRAQSLRGQLLVRTRACAKPLSAAEAFARAILVAGVPQASRGGSTGAGFGGGHHALLREGRQGRGGQRGALHATAAGIERLQDQAAIRFDGCRRARCQQCGSLPTQSGHLGHATACQVCRRTIWCDRAVRRARASPSGADDAAPCGEAPAGAWPGHRGVCSH
ncbi:hypothetical protein OY671_011358, partial [Metschnikowia pulcherrima]